MYYKRGDSGVIYSQNLRRCLRACFNVRASASEWGWSWYRKFF